MKSILPRGRNLVFYESTSAQSTDSTLQFGFYQQDDEYDDDETGFTATGLGDSGSPFWIESKDKNAKARQTIIATVSHSRLALSHTIYHLLSSYMKDEYKQCRDFSTKVTEDVSQWIMKLTTHFSKPK